MQMVYDYWKNFDIKSLQNDLSLNLLNEMSEKINEVDDLYRKSSHKNEEQRDTQEMFIKSSRQIIKRLNQISHSLLRIPDPLPAIETAIKLKSDYNDKLESLENETKLLRVQYEDQKGHIKSLYEQMAKKTSENLELKAKLKIADSEIEQYKCILNDCQYEISEMKNKSLSRASACAMGIKDELVSEHEHTRDQSPSPPASTSVPLINGCGSEPLNTSDIAQRVRDLLSANNIGQRIFAKFVLNLSQGTVSELLSKPKHWDKLTEKGRDSYRKMHQWSLNEDSIAQLKSFSPRKINKECFGGPNLSNSGNHDATASTEEKIAQILSEAQKQMQMNEFNKSRDNNSETYYDEDDDVDDIDEEYHDDNEHLYDRDTNNNNHNDPLDLTVKTPSLKRAHSADHSANIHKKLASSPLNSSSPLVQMQSFANNYLGKLEPSLYHPNKLQTVPMKPFSVSTPPPLPAQSQSQLSLCQKPLKSVLPPVSQEQFDRYSSISTEDLVKKVKDLLSKYSISQRLFGECILGLSQGSVSDLLARPKPWNMLTQKGREPFIRMQIFIEDPEAIKRLMSNQYNKAMPIVQEKSKSVISAPLGNSNSNSNFQPMSISNVSECSNDDDVALMSQRDVKPMHSHGSAQFHSQINIIPYDISAISSTLSEMNTDDITNRVKETLLNNNIGQKLFGEAVLNLSQGTVSELLSKPKPWNTLSIKGREPYLRMYMWLNDDLRLEKLGDWKEEKNQLKRNNAEVENEQQKPKRRFIFTEEQKDNLMRAFRQDPYPTIAQMNTLADQLGLAQRTVINWFHNHRMRIRYKNNAAAAAAQAAQNHNHGSFPSAFSANSLHRVGMGKGLNLGFPLNPFAFNSSNNSLNNSTNNNDDEYDDDNMRYKSPNSSSNQEEMNSLFISNGDDEDEMNSDHEIDPNNDDEVDEYGCNGEFVNVANGEGDYEDDSVVRRRMIASSSLQTSSKRRKALVPQKLSVKKGGISGEILLPGAESKNDALVATNSSFYVINNNHSDSEDEQNDDDI